MFSIKREMNGTQFDLCALRGDHSSEFEGCKMEEQVAFPLTVNEESGEYIIANLMSTALV